jgi:hypothetical protein
MLSLLAKFALGLVVDIVKDAITAERSPDLPGGTAKHESVQQLAIKRIDEADIDDGSRRELAKNLSKTIDGVVKVMNENGHFAKEPKDAK